MKLAFVFTQSPFASAASREGLDALLAATAFAEAEDIGVFFIEDGVLNLSSALQPHLLMQKDSSAAFKLLDLYDIEQRYAAEEAWHSFGMNNRNGLIQTQRLPLNKLMQKLATAEKVLTF
ncbi:sulfurtransferase complex subunit TusC [Testudinibacter aquarius]|uniref:Sulfurtransferase complex subunit TusC n=1 Tax=Testudinibacter aquarius TaxID=1524974 RepID=A0A4R3YA54_9PAST|nr:sulfurtransferase complex subunit TusC [Testudinibacter aquarius]TNG93038.1 sulfurtransferase complex subunit TusC [Pasteurellaceae bacterium USgator41]TNG97355.1 sulfurtransferase complex subunit TusC [Pasteurellaceae bacterium UScroc12]TNG97389.1 sulfurtransferase complex subunit TusC [Pasteurellaceae bacterium UScroc31]TNG99638.1 sulfurtransferase complex subunit TusC [Pasteurellaceae bacterium USgator11]KAE9528371.1 tRNA 2-thiouridine(34) synthase TusC [Testudinibacter aquarius]